MSYEKSLAPVTTANNNIGEPERIASITIGSALLTNSLVTGKHFKLVKALSGVYLILRGVTGYCPLYGSLTRNSTKDGVSNINVRTSVIINRNRHEVYNYWRRLENIPFLMKHIDSVKQIDPTYSEWKLKVPGNVVDISWKAQIVKDEPGSLIGWQSVEESMLQNAGKVEFRDAPNGETEVDVTITYHPPQDKAGNVMAHIFAPAFRRLVKTDVRNFKNLMESLNEIDAEHV